VNLPGWLDPLVEVAASVQAEQLSGFLPPEDGGGRPSAVLMLFWSDEQRGIQVLLIERARGLRRHAGQPAFPGGVLDPGDAGLAAAALRETVEETGLDPSGVQVFATLPAVFIPFTGYVVTPVLAWWREPSPVAAVDPAEVAAVHAVALADLVNPDNRVTVHHPPTGRTMPGFRVNGMLVWGFTAGLLDKLIRLAGWERPWSPEVVVDLPDDVLRLAGYPQPDEVEFANEVDA
jgi:8-oxo-dGTP pyrophosphatase MutT (NUDIX family)